MTLEELAKQNKAHGQLLGQIVTLLHQQKQQETDPIKQLLTALGGDETTTTQPKTAVEQLSEALAGGNKEDNPLAPLLEALGNKQKSQSDKTMDLVNQALGLNKQESQEGVLASVLKPIAERLDGLTEHLDKAERGRHRESVKVALKSAASSAGITNEAAQDDVVRLYESAFDMVDGELVMVKDGKPVDDPKSPGTRIGFDHFNQQLKEKSPHFYASSKGGDSTDLFSMFELDANGKQTIDTNGKVEINITDLKREYTDEEKKALAEGRHVYVMD